MGESKFADLLKAIIYGVIFVVVLGLILKVAVGIFKIVLILGLIWLAYRGILQLVEYIKNKSKEAEHKRRGYTVNEDGIVDVEYEEVKK
ncbi:hypothetical protein ACFIJ5_16185 [Haloimpatiens sp. FM7330]|uniref:hypothetical protein n=1 Tax=Haloimpatiens sp. FM7330 TaxID=3298610 RepID=UPI00362ECDA7